ncbi:MAG: hypothetical protein OHK0015_42890 [Chloroflexi bacterium OHK40]
MTTYVPRPVAPEVLQELDASPAKMLTYAEAAELLATTVRTIRRRVANGQYITYGDGSGRRLLYQSILADIRSKCGDQR